MNNQLIISFSNQELAELNRVVVSDFVPEDGQEYDPEIIGYECLACGHVQDDNDWGGECEVCTAVCLEPIYE